MSRKIFTEGQAVEVIPEPHGYRRRRTKESDWKAATYRHPGRDEMTGWHFVTLGSAIVHVPSRRIRARVVTTPEPR